MNAVIQGEIPYTLKTIARSKRVNITVRRDGSVLLTKPRWISKARAQVFFEKNRQWIERMQVRFRKLPQISRVGSSALDYQRFKREAEMILSERAMHFARLYEVAPQKITIRNQRTRWGSCSKKGTLSFNYRLAYLPQALVDYVIVHEICHLLELNHSRRFWTQVARAIPDHLARRRRLHLLER